MKYRKIRTYKYQLTDMYIHALPPAFDGVEAKNGYIQISHNILTIRIGYAWDGPSGPTFDTKDSMRGSLVHDALYQLIQFGYISKDYRGPADRLLYDICVQDGMWKPRAGLWHWAVRTFGAWANRKRKKYDKEYKL